MESEQTELTKLTELLNTGLILNEEFDRRVKEIGVASLQKDTPSNESVSNTGSQNTPIGVNSSSGEAPKTQVN